MSDAPSKPVPVPSALSAPYWEGLRAGELRLQTCADCGQLRHYPRLLCSHCYSRNCRWQVASGQARVHSYTVAHYAYHPAFADELPYTLVTVDLAEGPRALGRWLGSRPPAFGAAVRLRIRQTAGAPEIAFEPACTG